MMMTPFKGLLIQAWIKNSNTCARAALTGPVSMLPDYVVDELHKYKIGIFWLNQLQKELRRKNQQTFEDKREQQNADC